MIYRIVFGFFLILVGFSAQSKELGNRLGIGFRNAYSFDLPSLSTIYYPSPDTGVVGAVGIDTEKDASKSAFSIGVRRILFK